MNTVLFVDDEVNVLNSLRRGLIDQDYRCIFVESGAEAIKIIEKEEISVIVTDMRMPGMDGLTLLKIVKEKSPQTVRVVLSGYTQLQQILTTLNQADIFKFITKPWKLEEEFIDVIRQCIDYYNLQKESIELRKALEARNASYQNILRIMDEKVSEGKKDFDNIKSFGELAFDTIISKASSELKDSSNAVSKIMEEIKICQQFYTGYLAAIPTELVDFDIKRLIGEVECFLKGIHPDNKVLVSLDHATIQDFHDNFKLLMHILTSLWVIAPDKSYPAVMKGIVVTEQKDQGIKFEFYMEMESADSGLGHIEDPYSSYLLELVNMLYNELCKALKGNFSAGAKGNKLFLKVQVYLEKE